MSMKNFNKMILVLCGVAIMSIVGQSTAVSANSVERNKFTNTAIATKYKSKYNYTYKKTTNSGNQAAVKPASQKPKETVKQKEDKARQAEQQVVMRTPWDNGNLYESTQEIDSSGINESIRQMSRDAIDKKLVYINISKQQFTALEDGNIVRQSGIATGRNKFPTVQGEFQIWDKKYKKVLRSPSPEYGNYELPVDYWMPFHAGYGLHDAWWRSTFGEQNYAYNGSHGCVNMQYEDSKWIFEWSNIGTSVFISR